MVYKCALCFELSTLHQFFKMMCKCALVSANCHNWWRWYIGLLKPISCLQDPTFTQVKYSGLYLTWMFSEILCCEVYMILKLWSLYTCALFLNRLSFCSKGIGKISQNNLKNKQKFSIENVLFFVKGVHLDCACCYIELT